MLLFNFAYTFLLSPYQHCANMHLIHARKVDCGQRHCLLLLFLHTAKDCRGKLDVCRTGADQTTPRCQRCPQQHCVCTDPLRGEPAVVTPLFWLSPWSHLRHTETKALFLYLHLCLQCNGESLPMTFSWLLRGTHSPGKSGEHSLAMFPQTRGPWPDPEVQGLCFQEHLLSQPLSPSLLFLNLNLLQNKFNLNFNLPALPCLRHQAPSL